MFAELTWWDRAGECVGRAVLALIVIAVAWCIDYVYRRVKEKKASGPKR